MICYSEIIIWKQRLDLAQKFYSNRNLDSRKLILKEIDLIEKISHILIDSKNLPNNCKSLIDDKKFALVDAKLCYNLD